LVTARKILETVALRTSTSVLEALAAERGLFDHDLEFES
jgi:hypothetical protein